jgi:uncharacterized protein (UPF0276 family)
MKPEALSAGAGLRTAHYPELLERKSKTIQWFEVISENFMTSKGRPRWILETIRKDFPLAFHGVSLSIGALEPLDTNYLSLLRELANDFEPFVVSDHFCWTGLQNNNTHNLLPLPLTQRNLSHLVPRIQFVQEFLGRSLVLENASAYMAYQEDEIPEWEFIGEVCRRTGCRILLDINNLYVTSRNFGRDPDEVLRQVSQNLPAQAIAQIHLAGHTDLGTHLFDTHARAVQDPVWELYERWLTEGHIVPAMIEWDDEVPALEVLEAEVNKIRQLQERQALSSLSQGHQGTILL